KLTREVKERYLEQLAQGVRLCAAAKAVGIHRDTMREAKKNDPEFAEAIKLAQQEANEIIEDALFQTARKRNVVACLAWLYNRDPEHWKDMRMAIHQHKEEVVHRVNWDDMLGAKRPTTDRITQQIEALLPCPNGESETRVPRSAILCRAKGVQTG